MFFGKFAGIQPVVRSVAIGFVCRLTTGAVVFDAGGLINFSGKIFVRHDFFAQSRGNIGLPACGRGQDWPEENRGGRRRPGQGLTMDVKDHQ